MRYPTSLSTIRNHHIAIKCAGCGHWGEIAVREVKGEHVQDLVDRVRCGKCGARMPGEVRIFWKGHSEIAMTGSATRENGKELRW